MLTPILIFIAVGIWLFLRSNVRKIKQAPETYPYSQLSQDPEGDIAYIEREDGGRIRTISAGEGPTVVLAHGYGIALKEWNVVMPLLVEKGYHVIAFDQMGHGESTFGRNSLTHVEMASNYKRVLDHFKVQDGVLVGHSMGGFLSLTALLHFPEVVDHLKGLVLFASMAGEVSKGAPQNKLQIPMIKAGIMTAITKTELFGYPFGASLMGINPYAAAIRVFLENFAEQSHSKLIPVLKAMDEVSFYNRLGEITVPTVVVCGKKDGTTPPWHSETLGRDIPNARNVWVPDRGHLLNWEAPDALINVVTELHGSV